MDYESLQQELVLKETLWRTVSGLSEAECAGPPKVVFRMEGGSSNSSGGDEERPLEETSADLPLPPQPHMSRHRVSCVKS